MKNRNRVPTDARMTDNDTEEIKSTPPAPKSLKNYCLENGISLRRVARANRQYVSQRSEPRVGRLYWDNFSPPSGYVNDVDSFSQDPPQEAEKVSPAYLLTKSASQHQPKPWRPVLDPNFNIDEYFPLPDLSANCSTEENGDSLRAENITENQTGTTGSFPSFTDDDLSDSLLCNMSQKAEEEYCRAQGDKLKERANKRSEISPIGKNSETRVPGPSCVLLEDGVEENLCSTPLNAVTRGGYASRHTQHTVRRRLDLVPPECIGFEDMEDDDMDSILSQMEIP